MLLVIHGLPHLMEKASWSGEILSHEAPLAVPGCCWLLSFNLKRLSIARINQTGFGCFFFYFNQQRGAGVGRNHQVKHREHPQVVIWLCKCRLEATCGFLGRSSLHQELSQCLPWMLNTPTLPLTAGFSLLERDVEPPKLSNVHFYRQDAHGVVLHLC